MNDDLMVYAGSGLKVLGEGEVGGFAVMFTSPNDPDLTGEYFDAGTDFDLTDRKTIRVLFNHNLDPNIQGELARAKFEITPKGIWATAKLNLKNAMHRDLFGAVKRDKLGWSSAAGRHLVRYEAKARAKRIASWPLVEFSLTESPAEPRARAVALKSMDGARTLAELMGDQYMLNAVAEFEQTQLEHLLRQFDAARLR